VSGRVRVAVLLGGRSSEHDISLASARSVIDALDPQRYETVTVEIGRDGRWELGTGDNGSVAETLPVPTSKVPATLGEGRRRLPGPARAVRRGRHGAGHARARGRALRRRGRARLGAGDGQGCLQGRHARSRHPRHEKHHDSPGGRASERLRLPCFVKPARLGSSVGISKVHDDDELAAAVALAFEHDEKVLVEEFVEGVEVECGVLGNELPEASLPGEIVSHGFDGADWYDYSAKYAEGGMDLIVPPRLDQETIERVQELAVRAFVAGECEGMARVDFFVRPDGQVLVNELNTIPGFTATSVYAALFEKSGVPYPELVDRLVQLALERHERRSRLRY
jgi:D-alanine-D-alanine ligase